MTTFCKDGSGMPRASAGGKAFLRGALFALMVPLVVSCSLLVPRVQEARDLREKIFNAYGGRERLSQIHSIAAEGTITALAGGDHGTYRRALRRDGKLFVDIQYTKSRETRILNGTRALRSIDGKIGEASGPGYRAMVYQYNELSMPFALLDDSFAVSKEGHDYVNGAVVSVLRCTDRSGNSIDVFVDETTYRIVRTSGIFSVGDQSTMLSAEFGDFRFFDGVLMPFKIVNYVGDARISETVIGDYLFNARLSDTLFDLRAHVQEHSKD